MIETLITSYLKDNRRLVVPELGAFLRKDDEKVIFVPFLNKDDGILNALVKQSYGISQTEASSVISQYSNIIRSGIASNGYYVIKGIGALKKDVNGIIFLDATFSTSSTTPTPIAPPKQTIRPEVELEITKPNPVKPNSETELIKEERPIIKPVSIIEKATVRPSTKPIIEPRETHQPIKSSNKKPDIILIVAIIVATIAIAVMVYSYFVQELPVFNLM